MGCCGGDTPEIPDPSQAAIQGAQAQVELYPFTHAIETAAQRGEKVVIDGQTYDFSGLGEADYARKFSREMAKAALALQDKYGGEFIAERRKELDEADPEGTAKRKAMFEQIMNDLKSGAPDRPMSEELQSEIMRDLGTGGTLTDQERSGVQQGVYGKQARNGMILGNAAAREEAGAVTGASEQKRTAAQQRALQFLSSGQTPEDVDYQWNQQNLANLSNFMAGRTPEAEFNQLPNAQGGAVPNQSGAPYTAGVPETASAVANFNSRIYDAQNQFNAGQMNPWLAGLGLGASSAGLWGSLFKQSSAGSSVPQMSGDVGQM